MVGGFFELSLPFAKRLEWQKQSLPGKTPLKS